MVTLFAQAPKHSAQNWEVEGQWPQARICTRGQHLGRTAYEGDPLLAGDSMEDVCRKISAAGVEEYCSLLEKLQDGREPVGMELI